MASLDFTCRSVLFGAKRARLKWTRTVEFTKPFICCYSNDAITRGGESKFIQRVPGARAQAHKTIESNAHFLQEENGPQLAGILVEFITWNQK